jgi:tripartite-type tricarboxylate transporter receptor subunit TctC
MHRLASVLIALALTSFTPALAQDYPGTKPIKLIVPFPPGGGTDIMSRVIANRLAEDQGWVIVVDNKPGAGGNIGVAQAAKSPADGYTVVMGQTSNLAINPTLYTNLPYDPLKDLAPVVLVGYSPVVFVTGTASPLKSFADVIAAAKAKPGEVTLASPGNGTVSHLTGELVQHAAGIQLQHVPYKGASQAMTDVLAGRVDIFASSVPSALAQINGGSLRALAVTSLKRSPALPDVPTVAESGLAGFDATTWLGLLVPAGTPRPIVARINTAVNTALKLSAVREKIASEGGDALGGSPEQFAALLKTDYAKWAKVVKDSGAKLD